MTIAENIARIRANMAAAAREAGRDPKEILLVGASKMNDAAACREAIAAGIDALGENRVQEMTAHHTVLSTWLHGWLFRLGRAASLRGTVPVLAAGAPGAALFGAARLRRELDAVIGTGAAHRTIGGAVRRKAQRFPVEAIAPIRTAGRSFLL